MKGSFEGLKGYAVGRMTKSRRGKLYIDDAGWDIRTADTVGGAWDSITRGKPDLVLLDIELPGMSGVDVARAETIIDDLEARNKECKAAGKEPIKAIVEQEQSKVTASLVSGKTEAMAADSPISLYAVKQQGDELEALGDIYDSAPYGIVVPKDQTELADAIAEALAAMKEDGSYEQALKNWGNEAGAIDEFAVNP